MEKEEEEDRISSSPDSLILEILSRLPSTKEAIKTGTLSKRWRHLWTIVPNLIFLRFWGDNPPLRDFVSLVENTLAQCRHLNLKKFQLLTQYNIQFEPQFNKWIQFAIRCNVQELDLSLCRDEFMLNDYFFTATCFTHLTLSGCVFNLNPGGVITWNKLTYLCISNGKLNEDLIQTILSGSPLLETLELSDCYGYKRLNITSKSVKKLLFSGYANGQNEIIEINAPYILSLRIEFSLFLWKLLLLDVSSIVEAFLDYSKEGYYETTSKVEKEDMLKGFILKLRHIKKLTIGISCARTLSRLEAKGLTLPPNLKVLDVTSPEYGDGSSDVICEPSESESNVSGDWEEPLLDESSEVDELFETVSYENGDWEEEGSEVDEFDSDSHENGDAEEPLLDESSEADELSENNSVENGDWDDPLLDEGAEVDDLSQSDSAESRDD